MDNIAAIILVMVILIASAFGPIRVFRRSRDMLNNWARRHGLKMNSAGLCWFLRGPFTWSASTKLVVYRISAIDRDGESRSGWARCGRFWRGLFNDRVDICWDEAG